MSQESQALSRNSYPSPNQPLSTIDVTAADMTIAAPGPGLKRDYSGLLEYWQMARRHKGAVLLAIVVGGVLGFMMTLADPRIYQARTTLEYQGINEEFLDMKKVNPVADSSAYLDSDIATQVKILQSRALIGRVREKMVTHPQPEALQPADRLGMWRKALKISPPTTDALWKQALSSAAAGVRVRSSGATRIIDVSCDSTNGQVAADFCNTLAQEYIDQALESRWRTTEYTGQWLTKQLDDLKIKLEKQEEEMQAYANATGLVMTSEKNNAQEAQLADLEKELSTARADRIAKQSKHEMAESSPPGALPEILDDPTQKTAQSTLDELRSKLALLRVTYTTSYAEVRKVMAQIATIESSIEGTRGNVATRIRKEYEAAVRREKLLESAYQEKVHQLAGKAEETAHYNLLKRDVDGTRAMYESLTQRLKEASIASALRANNVRVVDTAERPKSPYKPDVAQRVTLGLVLGLVVGVAFSVLRERADRTLQDPGDVSYYLHVPELGVVPVGELIDLPRSGARKRAPALGAAAASSASLSVAHRVELISWRQKTSLLAESFRTTLTSILFSRRAAGSYPRVLVLTSASPKEGKTTVVSNLSITVAEIRRRVLVIDADMRRPRLHKVFSVENDHGLSNLLMEAQPLDAAALEGACVPTQVPHLFLLPSGTSRTHASSLVHAERLPELIALAREMFDMVIIDTPPMVNIADARVLARYGDALILVVRSGQTTRDAAQLAQARFAEDGTAVLGTILNFWNPKTPGYGYYKYYYAGYYHYYGDGSSRNNNGDGGMGSDGIEPDDATPSEPKWTPDVELPGSDARNPRPRFARSHT
jgi:capsular exopolysaccharide synthesis family protein